MCLPIFIINLKKDITKKKHMQKLCQKYNLEVEFIEAVNGRGLSQEEVNRVYSKEESINAIGRELSKGEIGCALSHKKIYQRIVEEDISIAMVLEDDVAFDKQIISLLKETTVLNSQADIVMLGYWYYGASDITKYIYKRGQKQINTNYKLVRFTQEIHGTYGYLVTKKGAEKLLTHLENKIYLPIDHYITNPNIVNIHGVYPPVVTLSEAFSIDTELEKERKTMQKKASHKSVKYKALKSHLNSIGLLPFFKFIWKKFLKIKKNLMLFYRRNIAPKDFT